MTRLETLQDALQKGKTVLFDHAHEVKTIDSLFSGRVIVDGIHEVSIYELSIYEPSKLEDDEQ